MSNQSGQIGEGAVPNPSAFATTRWSVVLAAGQIDAPEAAAALAVLCRSYWYPLYAHVRRRGHDATEAQDLTQAFFERLLETEYFSRAQPGRGRFRSFLLGSLDHFLANQFDRRCALKRGGGHVPVSLDLQDAEGRYLLEPADPASPADAFDRRWALALLDHALGRLRGELEAAGKSRQFETLKPFLSHETPAGAYEPLAAELGLTVGAVRMAVSRLRERFGELVRAQVADTVSSEPEIGEEMRYLIELVCQ